MPTRTPPMDLATLIPMVIRLLDRAGSCQCREGFSAPTGSSREDRGRFSRTHDAARQRTWDSDSSPYGRVRLGRGRESRGIIAAGEDDSGFRFGHAPVDGWEAPVADGVRIARIAYAPRDDQGHYTGPIVM